jgi:hypothetical protein
MSDVSDAEAAELQKLEESLWREETRFDPAYMEDILAADFFEFGRSGRIYRREDTLNVPSGSFETTSPLPDFRAHAIAPDVVLVTYRSEVRFGDIVEFGNRSSLWSKETGKWKIRFHQGTALHQGADFGPDLT